MGTMLCECGCGQPAPIAKQTCRKRGWIKGQPIRFIHGHNERKKEPNKYAHLADGTLLVMLERSDGTVLPCFVDASDWEKIRLHRWSAHKRGTRFYAGTMVHTAEGKITMLLLHRLLVSSNEDVDHHDCNGLNNSRENLRPATRSQNMGNQRKQSGRSSQFKGVCWDKQRKKWKAAIKFKGKSKNLGYFIPEVDAARAYDVAALQNFGEFARLNFPKQRTAA